MSMHRERKLTEDDMYRALVEKDPALDGVFYTGVKTTGIFCRCVCTARKPKRENVTFYRTLQEAMAAGFRPCKICRPLEGVGKMPTEIAALIREVEEQPQIKIKEGMLRERGLDPATVRRWFQKHYGMTFQSFCRMNRINAAFGSLRAGEKVLDTALSTGYDSISGFSEAFGKATGMAPSQASQSDVMVYCRFDSPLGPMITVATSVGVCLVEFGDRRMLESELKDLQQRLKLPLIAGRNTHTDQVQIELSEYFKGMRKTFDVPLVTPGTDFQRQAWQTLQTIPYGSTSTYGEMAVMMERPHAVRAVGHANGMNRIAIIIPCHRVIGADGKLVGYGGGIWRKEWLLTHEKSHL